MNTNKKSQQLLYVVRNNHSILGVYTSLKKAYIAGHTKAIEVQLRGYSEHHMELKVVRPNSYNYVGCSAYKINFLAVYSNKELKDLAQKIQDWFRCNKRYVEEYENDLQF